MEGAESAGVFLCCVDESGAEAGLLLARIDGQQTEIGAIPFLFHKNTAIEAALLFGDEKAASLEVFAGGFGVEAVVLFEEFFDGEGSVYERHEGGKIGFGGEAEVGHGELGSKEGYCRA